MKIKNAFSTALFFSFLLVTSYCFCQHPQESANTKIKAQSTPTPAAVASTTDKGEPGILPDVKRVSDEHPQESAGTKMKAQSMPTPASVASTPDKGELGILQDVKRVSDEHPQEAANNKIKAQPAPITGSIAPAQKQLPIQNAVKLGAAEKSPANKEAATGKGEPGILQDVQRVSDEHPKQ